MCRRDCRSEWECGRRCDNCSIRIGSRRLCRSLRLDWCRFVVAVGLVVAVGVLCLEREHPVVSFVEDQLTLWPVLFL